MIDVICAFEKTQSDAQEKGNGNMSAPILHWSIGKEKERTV